MDTIHKTVLLNETIEGLGLSKNKDFENFQSLNSEKIILDATFGGGGHSFEILKRYSNVKIIALDQDKSVWKKAKNRFRGLEKRIYFLNLNFRDLNIYFKRDVEGKEKVDAVIFDLGLSSDQLENSKRGFSFMRDEPLLMTMKENPTKKDLTAKDIVNTWSEESLANIIYGYGEEKFSRRIAKGIIEARLKNKIETTFDLVKIIEENVPAIYKRGRLHFATKTFQALRIAVNDELGALETGLSEGFSVLKNGGRMAIISFHSLEDRIVKRFYKNKKEKSEAILINKKPIIPKAEEVKNNRKSRSAKLRILEKI